jgi:NAD(P)-dependent dehydrogenase (short-subunit alcohol dehydrogenase family)
VELTGRGALVTGGSGDLGAAICRALAKAGADVAIGFVGNRGGRRGPLSSCARPAGAPSPFGWIRPIPPRSRRR